MLAIAPQPAVAPRGCTHTCSLFRSQPTTIEQHEATMQFLSTSPSPRKHQDISKRKTLKKGRDIRNNIFANFVNT
jgi:hypothetical protein